MSFADTMQTKAIDLTEASHRMTAAAASGHPTSAASLAHVVAVLMYDHMRWDPERPRLPGSDRLVLSEGHACPVVYAAAADLGVKLDGGARMAMEDAMTLREIDSPVEGHPHPREGFTFFDTATGSLGQGLSHAAGLALAARLDGFDNEVYALIGDGESREGQVWEALDFLVDHDLRTVCPIFNCNGLAQSDPVAPGQTADGLAQRLEAVGFQVLDVDGHDADAIKDALRRHRARRTAAGRPIAIVARTVKGWGTPTLQGEGHHGKAPDVDQLDTVIAELAETRRGSAAARVDGPIRPEAPASTPSPSPETEQVMSFEEALRAFDHEDWVEGGQLSTRKAYGLALRALGHARPDVVALDGDVKNSTYSELFANDDALASRFFECRIAEQNMVSTAAGLAAAGKIPFVSTFGKFLTRAYDQIEMALLGGAALRLVGSHCGISLAADGPSQMALPDVAWFRALSTVRDEHDRPLVHVLTPSDAPSAYALTCAMAELDTAIYLRTIRPDMDLIEAPAHDVTIGGHRVLREGSDLLITATGYMVHVAKKAVEQLERDGVDATLVDLYSLPFDEDALTALAKANGGRVLTVEDNYGNAYGSAVADACAASPHACHVEQMAVRILPKSGRAPEDLLRTCGLTVADVHETARRTIDGA